MQRLLSIAVGLGAVVALAGSAAAADLITYPTSTDQQVPVASSTPAYDWTGFYAGVYGAYRHSPADGNQFGIGIDAGVSTTFNFVLAGAEVAVEGLGAGAGGASYAEALGRAGVLVGDNTLLYGTAGYGTGLGGTASGQSDVLVGAGLEQAITDSVSLRAQYLHGFPITGANPKDEVTLGAQFHF